MPLPGFLKDLIGGGAAKLGEAVKDIIDESKFSAEEKAELELKMSAVVNAHTEELAKLAQAELESYLKDTQSARDAYTRIQESDKSSWLSKNIAPILTLVVTIGFFGMLGYMLKYTVPTANERIMDILLGSLGTAWITIIGFFFGSSRSSENKSDQIHKMINK